MWKTDRFQDIIIIKHTIKHLTQFDRNFQVIPSILPQEALRNSIRISHLTVRLALLLNILALARRQDTKFEFCTSFL